MLIRRQANRLGYWIIVVAAFCRLDNYRLQPVPVQQVPGEAGARAGIAIVGLAVFLEYSLYPDTRAKHDCENHCNNKEICHVPIVTRRQHERSFRVDSVSIVQCYAYKEIEHLPRTIIRRIYISNCLGTSV